MLDSSALRNRRSTRTLRHSSFSYDVSKYRLSDLRTSSVNKKFMPATFKTSSRVYIFMLLGVAMLIFGGALLSFDNVAITGRLFKASKPKFDFNGHINKELHKNFVSAETAIDSILKLMRNKEADSLNPDISREIDMHTATSIEKYCVEELPFELTVEAKTTLHSHISFALHQISDKAKIEDFTASATVVTYDGTIIDLAHSRNNELLKKYSTPNLDYAQCRFVNALVEKSKELHLTDRAVIDEFTKTNVQEWKQTKTTFSDNIQLNKDLYHIISLAKKGGSSLHQAEQIMVYLLTKYCSNVMTFLKQHNQVSKDIDFASSVSNILHQLSREQAIHLSHDEIPAIDTAGYVVAVKPNIMNIGTQRKMKREIDYITCPFVEKLVYYRNIPLKYQIENTLEQLLMNNVYAFESKMDVLMEEHCPNVVDKLQNKKTNMKHEHSVYQSVFRGELLNFATQVADGIYLGDSNDYIITSKGAILVRDVAIAQNNIKSDEILECSLISEISKQNQATKPENYDDTKNELNQHKFDPNFKDDALVEELKNIDNDIQQNNDNQQFENKITVHAQNVVQHLINSNDKYQFRRLLAYVMNAYHEKELTVMNEDMVTKILSEIEQFLSILIKHSLGVNKWPKSFVAVITKQDGRVLIQDKDKEEFRTLLENESIIVSEMLSSIFKEALEVDVGERTSIKELIKKRKQEYELSNNINNIQNEKQQSNDETLKFRDLINKKSEQKNSNHIKPRTILKSDGLKLKHILPKKKSTAPSNHNLGTYTKLVWQQINEVEDINTMSEDIFHDLEKYCHHLFVDEQMQPYNQRNLKMNVLSTLESIKQDNNAIMNNPVIIIDDGSIVASHSVAPDQQFANCPFITHLLSQN